MSATRWTLGILGLWIALSAFLQFGHQGDLWNDLLVGTVVLILGITLAAQVTWSAWTVGVLGGWLIVAAFLPTLHSGSAILWNNLIIGLGVAGVAAVSVGGKSQKKHTEAHI